MPNKRFRTPKTTIEHKKKSVNSCSNQGSIPSLHLNSKTHGQRCNPPRFLLMRLILFRYDYPPPTTSCPQNVFSRGTSDGQHRGATPSTAIRSPPAAVNPSSLPHAIRETKQQPPPAITGSGGALSCFSFSIVTDRRPQRVEGSLPQRTPAEPTTARFR